MTNALVFDIESSGLPQYGEDHPADDETQPRLCAISMALIEVETGDTVDRFDTLVKPENWPITNIDFYNNMKKAEGIHHLSYEYLLQKGIPIDDVYRVWQGMYADAAYVSAFNITFDHKIVRGEWKRLGHPIPFRHKQWFCLMHTAAGVIKPGYRRISAPKACKELLGYEHLDNHNSVDDLNFNLDLFRVFAERRLIVLEDQPEAKKKGTHAESQPA